MSPARVQYIYSAKSYNILVVQIDLNKPFENKIPLMYFKAKIIFLITALITQFESRSYPTRIASLMPMTL